MLEKSLFKCAQNCNKCQNSCELKPCTADLNIFFEKIILELDILNLAIVINIIQVIDSIKDSDSEKISQNNEGYISVIFRTNRKNNLNISEEDLTKLKQDIRDLGKFRIIKEGRRFLKE